MNKSIFDQIIKTNLSEIVGDDKFGYKVASTSREYGTYYSNQAFSEFIKEMQVNYNSAFLSYSNGKGSELIEHKGRYGMMPPKMASVASSSRLCYLALRYGAAALGGSDDIEFEHECKIEKIDGIAPQLDAFEKNENIFIEVKCHEIFDSHSVCMKEKYRNLICGTNNQFGFAEFPLSNNRTFNIPLSSFGLNKNSSMFDIKQLLCHLMGIASHPGESKKLVYLFFWPESDDNTQKEIDAVFLDLRDEIHTIFESAPIKSFCDINSIELRAYAEKSRVMMALTKDNIKVLY